MRASVRNRGFTLAELMVSLAVLGVVSLYLTEMLVRQSRAYTVVDHVTEVQQNVRAISELMEHEIRLTGLLVPEGAALCGRDNQNGSDILFVTDSDALTINEPNQTELRYELGAEITNNPGLTSNSAVLIVDNVVLDGVEAYDTSVPLDGVADSDFRPGAGVIVWDRGNPDRGVACGIIASGPPSPIAPTQISGVDFAAGSNQALAPAPPGTEELVAVPAHVYQVQNGQLLRDGRVLAEDVEDFQVAFHFDLDGNGGVDLPLEFPGAQLSPLYDPTGFENEELRAVRISFVVRSRAEDPDFTQAGAGQFQRLENRNAVAGNDGFRRRVYSATIRPRNVGKRAVGGSS